MSAETLRRAAALMRERAEAATPGPWSAAHGGVITWRHQDYPGVVVPTEGRYGQSIASADAHHIAPFASPAVALAVAALLDEVALRREYVEERELALAVAHAYLGEDA